MARIGGDVIAYLRTLAVFGGDGREKIKEIRQSIDDDDLRRFTIGVHALKSAAGNIGACALSELAKEFETAGRNEDREFINKNSPRLLADFEALLRGIDETLLAAKEKRSQIVVDKEAIKSTLADLNTAIDALDPDGINAAAGELRRLGIIAEIGDEIEIILRKTLVGDFDEAISLIEKLLRQKA
jgi:HPt (histidine-containing phosphotransfer) domain-containing protein